MLIFLFVAQVSQLLFKLGDLVSRHLLGCFHVHLSLVLLQVSDAWHVDCGDVAVLPELGRAGLRLGRVARNDWQLKARVFLFLSHKLADVLAELGVELVRLRVEDVVIEAASLHDGPSRLHRHPHS